MGLGSEAGLLALESVWVDLDFLSFKAFKRFLRHSQTANKMVSSKSRIFKDCVPK